MKKSILLFIFIQILVSTNFAQVRKVNFYPPLKGKLLISGNFCEFRPNHFHAGLDFKTQGENRRIYAVADGYVSRIKVSGDGYGNALYITHPQLGYKTLYGHLNAYCPELQEKVREIQKELHSFAFDMEFDSNFFPVKKGQLVAYSGNTGRSFGAHLHFELRNLDDEPINPQLFNFKIKDTRPPEIKRIAIYPADTDSYVNGKNKPVYYNVQNGKVNGIPTVHGNIYFGVEAYDYLDDYHSRNAYYSTKIFVDGKLLYYSKFDSISYLHNRDINSMVDYPKRLVKGWRIQRTLVEPNNQLYHYVNVKNHGIFKFNDKLQHKIKFIINDVYGNSTSLTINIKSTSTPKKFKQQTYKKILEYNKVNIFKQAGIEIYFPENSLFDNVYFNFHTSEGNKYSPVYHIGNEYIPLKEPAILSLNIALVPEKYKPKAVICYKNYKNKIKVYTGTVSNNFLSVFIKNFGRYYVDIDTIPPNIKLIKKDGILKFKVIDDLSGLLDYKGFINNQPAIFAYDAKNNLIYYKFDDLTQKGKNTAALLVTDAVGNTSVMKIVFYR